jgi:DNA-binding MarR family transcriptional regulator
MHYEFMKRRRVKNKLDKLTLRAFNLLSSSNKLENPTASFISRHLDISWERANKILKQLEKEELVEEGYNIKNLVRFRRKHGYLTIN